jgi:hypothetical protein
MLRPIIAGVILAALAFAILYPLTPRGGVRRGPDFLAVRIDLPEARYFGQLPAAPVLVLSEEGVFFDGEYVLPLDEANLDTNWCNQKFRRLSREWGGREEAPRDRSAPAVKYLEIIIQADEGVDFEALKWAMWTSATNGFAKPYLAAWDPESKCVKGAPIIVPCFTYFRHRDLLILSILVEEEGFRVSRPGALLPFTGKKGNEYDYRFLETTLKDVKKNHGRRCNNVCLDVTNEVVYGDVIRFLDIIIGSGFEPRDISLAGAIE